MIDPNEEILDKIDNIIDINNKINEYKYNSLNKTVIGCMTFYYFFGNFLIFLGFIILIYSFVLLSMFFISTKNYNLTFNIIIFVVSLILIALGLRLVGYVNEVENKQSIRQMYQIIE